MFPEQVSDNLIIAPFKPHGNVKYKEFLNRRVLNAYVFGILALLIYYKAPAQFYWFLTVWGIIMAAIFYWFVVFCHWYNGDFERAVYTQPTKLNNTNTNDRNVFDTNLLPWKYWFLIHAFYELTLIVNTVVAFAFWCIEGPFMIYNRAIAIPSTSAFGFIVTFVISAQHIAPFVLILFEWWHNSIAVSNDRFWVYLSIGLIYVLMLIILEVLIYPGYTIYHSIDFSRQPLRSSIMCSLIIGAWAIASFLWPIFTKIKLKKLSTH